MPGKKTEYWFIFIHGCVEPELYGPWDEEDERDQAAKDKYHAEGEEHGYFPLRCDEGVPSVGFWTNGFFNG